jgi:galactose mutarotase-like enzyme
MAPFAGRVARGRFDFEGTRHELPLNAGEDAAHGLVEDVCWTVVSTTETRIALSCELGPRWSFGGHVEQTVELTNSGLTLTLMAINDICAMPATLGFHPWFRKDAGTGGPATYSVRPGYRYLPDGSGALPSLTADLGTRPWDDVFSRLESPPTINWPGGPTVRITSNGGAWIVYERLADAFCIEPLTAPPGSLGRDPAAVVRPGNPLVLTMRLSWFLPESQQVNWEGSDV